MVSRQGDHAWGGVDAGDVRAEGGREREELAAAAANVEHAGAGADACGLDEGALRGFRKGAPELGPLGRDV